MYRPASPAARRRARRARVREPRPRRPQRRGRACAARERVACSGSAHPARWRAKSLPLVAPKSFVAPPGAFSPPRIAPFAPCNCAPQTGSGLTVHRLGPAAVSPPAVRRGGRGHAEPGPDVETACRVRAVPDLEAARAATRKAAETLAEDAAGQTASLVLVLDSHRLHKSDLGHRVEPEQRVAGGSTVGILDGEVELRVVERALPEASLHFLTAPSP